MALQKPIEHLTGASSTYWRINRIIFDNESKCGSILLAGYYDQQSKINGKQPLDSKHIPIPQEIFITYFSPDILDDINPTKQAYLYIKTIPGFDDATDV